MDFAWLCTISGGWIQDLVLLFGPRSATRWATYLHFQKSECAIQTLRPRTEASFQSVTEYLEEMAKDFHESKLFCEQRWTIHSEIPAHVQQPAKRNDFLRILLSIQLRRVPGQDRSNLAVVWNCRARKELVLPQRDNILLDRRQENGDDDHFLQRWHTGREGNHTERRSKLLMQPLSWCPEGSKQASSQVWVEQESNRFYIESSSGRDAGLTRTQRGFRRDHWLEERAGPTPEKILCIQSDTYA